MANSPIGFTPQELRLIAAKRMEVRALDQELIKKVNTTLHDSIDSIDLQASFGQIEVLLPDDTTSTQLQLLSLYYRLLGWEVMTYEGSDDDQPVIYLWEK